MISFFGHYINYIHAIFLLLCVPLFLFIKTEKYDSTTLISRIISIGIGFAILVLAFYIAMEFDPFFCTYQHFFRMRLGFDDYNNFGYLYFGLDGISILFFILTIILAFLCSLFILHEDNYQHKVYLLFIIEGLLLIIFSTIDLLLFYICFEGVLIPMYLLIGTYGSRERKIRASYLFFFYTLGSSILVLLAILQIYNTVGSLSFLDLCFSDKFDDSTEQYFIWFAFFLSFAAKIPMFPFHIWLPEAHVEAPTVGSVLLAGILLKLGVYGFIRVNLCILPQASIFFSPYISWLAIFGIIYPSFAALGQTDLKRIIAYSSIAHMNLVVLGIFSFNSVGLQGAIMQSISHGFVSGGLFFLIGILYDRYHTRYSPYYGGMIYFMPIFTAMFFIFTLANIAVPGSSSFIGEFLLLLGIFKKSITYGIFATIGVILSGTYSLWLFNKLVYGQSKPSQYLIIYEDITVHELGPIIILLIYIIALGIFPDLYVLHYTETYCETIEDYFIYKASNYKYK